MTFERESAAKTALLLDNTQLGATKIHVSGAEGAHEVEEPVAGSEKKEGEEITQEEKPRSRIVAEYLAHGYVLGDQAAARALEIDQKHGLSTKFRDTLYSLDDKYKAREKAKTADKSYGISAKASGLLGGLTSYYERAAGTPTGQKLVNFYTQTQTQVEDIHNEARRLADLKKQEAAAAKCKCGEDSSLCKCAPGSCDCGAKCGGNSQCKCAPGSCDCKAKSGGDASLCKCGADPSQCKCAPGSCNCGTKSGGGMTCGCGGDPSACKCASGQCVCADCPKAGEAKKA